MSPMYTLTSIPCACRPQRRPKLDVMTLLVVGMQKCLRLMRNESGSSLRGVRTCCSTLCIIGLRVNSSVPCLSIAQCKGIHCLSFSCLLVLVVPKGPGLKPLRPSWPGMQLLLMSLLFFSGA